MPTPRAGGNGASRPKPSVGATPADVVHRENTWQLLRYRQRPRGAAHATPSCSFRR